MAIGIAGARARREREAVAGPLASRIIRFLRFRGFGIASGLVAFLFVFFFAYPIGRMLYAAFFVDGQLSLQGFILVYNDPDLVSLLVDTALVAGIGSVVALVIAAFFAWLNERTDAGMGWISRVLPLVPLMLPPIALSTGWFFLGHERA